MKLLQRILAGAAIGLATGAAGGAFVSAVYVVRSAYIERGLMLAAAYEWNRFLFRTTLSVVLMGIFYALVFHIARKIARRKETAQAVTASLVLIQIFSTLFYLRSHGAIIEHFLSRFRTGDKAEAALQARIFADSQGGWSIVTILLVIAGGLILYLLLTTPATLLLRPLFRRLNRSAITRWRWRKIVVAAALCSIAVLGLSLAMQAVAARGSDPSAPRVVLISLDTVGAEYLGAYGDPQARTPVLDQFMKRAALFSDVSVAEPFTLTSHITMLTSLYPGAQGVNLTQGLRLDRITLAEVFRNQGYETGGFSTSSWLDPIFGFDQGFAYYSNTVRATADEVNRDAFRWIQLFRRRPFFVFLHYYDAHSDPGRWPYDAPDPYPALFEVGLPGTFDGCRGADCATWLLLKVDQGLVSLTPAETASIRGFYYASIAWLDAQIGQLFRKLAELDLWEEAIIVITADHGEQMLQHGGTMHDHLYQEVLRVPLAIRVPAVAAGRIISAPVQSIDLAPTLLSAAGLPVPADFQGRDLAPSLTGGAIEVAPRFSVSSSLPGTMLIPGYVIEHSGRKLIVRAGNDGPEQLYDTINDPGEMNPLNSDAAPETAQLRETLQTWIEDNLLDANESSSDGAPLLDQAAQEELRALGYLN